MSIKNNLEPHHGPLQNRPHLNSLPEFCFPSFEHDDLAWPQDLLHSPNFVHHTMISAANPRLAPPNILRRGRTRRAGHRPLPWRSAAVGPTAGPTIAAGPAGPTKAAGSTGSGVNWVNVVEEFGADPTGSTDSTSAIRNAIAYLGTL